MALQDLCDQEARLTKVIASEKARQQVLERKAEEINENLVEIDRRLDLLYQNVRAMKGAAVVKIDAFKNTQEAVWQYEQIYSKTIDEAEETNAQIFDNAAILTKLDAELSFNLIEQSQFGQLFFLDDYRGGSTPDR